jgi:uncharacterized protein YciI
MQDIRFVIVHRAGPKWISGKPMFEQPGLGEHIAHYRQLLEAGKLLAGGPFLDGFAAGMMVSQPGQSEEEIREFAELDPAVKGGLLVAEVHPWLVGMRA